MGGFLSVFWSTLGKKILTALTGLALFLFVTGHLGGNLLILVGPEAFNAYSHKLISLGPLLYVIEALLVLVFLVHIVFAVAVTLTNRKARPDRYTVTAGRGQPSQMGLSSKNMIWTGLILLVFTVLHIKTFKYGPAEAQGYVASLQGESVRDLYRLVVEVFSQEVYVIGYVVAMLLLGFHLRHGFWSAFQSLGANHPRYMPIVQGIGVVAAILLAVGFLFLPVWVYIMGAVS
jgi:succinate dehydrogenase / fumarate reductase cytochrome b subunit